MVEVNLVRQNQSLIKNLETNLVTDSSMLEGTFDLQNRSLNRSLNEVLVTDLVTDLYMLEESLFTQY